MPKVDRIVELMERRIARGDYALRPLPAETRLASETGVSRMTARKAVFRLLDRGLLSRLDNGRLVVNTEAQAVAPSVERPKRKGGSRSITPKAQRTSKGLIGFALPIHGSTEFDRWRMAAERAVGQANRALRLVPFHHWDDPILVEAFDTFDGMFLLPPAEEIPPNIVKAIHESKSKIVALDADLTPHGIRSVELIPPSSVQRLLDHLAGLGHRVIHCVNSQPMDSVIIQRIQQWVLWRSVQDIKGELLNEPDQSYGDPARKGYDLMARRLAAGPLAASAIIAMTMPAAMGVQRALYERGIVVGKDISLCVANDEGLAAYLCPSMTATRMPDPLPYLTVCLEWMTGDPFNGPLLMRPTDVPLFLGESTGPAPL
ncbi:MAG: yvoA [Phycisphaerales bacterium]|nr:yvoA [Phycisphaerales bacterium]